MPLSFDELPSDQNQNSSTVTYDVHSKIRQNHDILSVVFDFLTADPTSEIDTVRGEERGTLLNAALACKAFKEPALNALWRVLHSFLPLFHLLPSFTRVNDTYILEDMITVQNWEKFDYYARRVRVLFLTGPAPSTSRYVYICIQQQRSSPLTPGVKKLYIDGYHFTNLSCAFLALNSGLEVVELHGPVLGNSGFLSSFLQTLRQQVPKLRRLLLENKNVTNLKPILWFDNVEQVEIKLANYQLSSGFIDQLGNLANLRILVLHVCPLAANILLPLRQSKADSQISTRRFDQVHSLHLIGQTRSFAWILRRMDLRNIKRLVFEEVSGGSEAGTETFWVQCVRKFSTSENLEEVEIRQREDGQSSLCLGSRWMSSLFQHHLKSLVVTGTAYSASDDDILRILVAFPSLKKLILPSFVSKSWPTMASIFQLTHHCRQLEEVEIFIGGTFDRAVEIMQDKINQIPRRHNHPLRVLRISSNFGPLQHRDIAECARFLYRAFPNLVTIEGIRPSAANESWTGVQIFYSVLQRELRVLGGQCGCH